MISEISPTCPIHGNGSKRHTFDSQATEDKLAKREQAVKFVEAIIARHNAAYDAKLAYLEAKIEAMSKSAPASADASEIESMKADLLELSTNFGKIKEMLATGKGLHKNNDEILPSEYKQFAPQRIHEASLDEIVALVEGA